MTNQMTHNSPIRVTSDWGQVFNIFWLNPGALKDPRGMIGYINFSSNKTWALLPCSKFPFARIGYWDFRPTELSTAAQTWTFQAPPEPKGWWVIGKSSWGQAQLPVYVKPNQLHQLMTKLFSDGIGLTMTELSPAARAVFESFNSRFDWVEDGVPGPAIAAALHAAASQLLAVQWNGQIPVSATEQIGINWARDALHVLANELEA